MKKRSDYFDVNGLRQALEKSLGFAIRPLQRLGGSVARNYKAVRADDGMTFAVKCLPQEKRFNYESIVEHMNLLTEFNIVKRVFQKECVPQFDGYEVICSTWCDGAHMFPDGIPDGMIKAFLDDYRSFSAAIQAAGRFGEPRPVVKMREEVLAKCNGPFAGALRRRMEKMRPEDYGFRPELMRVIHGDFHHGNFLFVEGRVRGFLDLEEFRAGYPTEDFVRYFSCAADHLRWYGQHRRRRMLKLFRYAVENLPYSLHEWRTALNVSCIGKAWKKVHRARRIGFVGAVKLWWCYRFYDRMYDVVETVFGPAGERGNEC